VPETSLELHVLSVERSSGTEDFIAFSAAPGPLVIGWRENNSPREAPAPAAATNDGRRFT
jgi:hypothetical protein